MKNGKVESVTCLMKVAMALGVGFDEITLRPGCLNKLAFETARFLFCLSPTRRFCEIREEIQFHQLQFLRADMQPASSETKVMPTGGYIGRIIFPD